MSSNIIDPGAVARFRGAADSTRPGRVRLPLLAIVFLALTATLCLLWSPYKVMDNDELFVLQTDSVSSIGQLIHIQLKSPISLDPFFYHLLSHLSIDLFGANPLAIRLPALFGYLMMQVCAFVFVRRIASERAALLALAIPALSPAMLYAIEARPYGLLFGLVSLTMVGWQGAIRSESRRTGSLVLLALAICLTLNTHYYGVLMLIPLYAAELYRTIERRRPDFAVIGSIVAGTAGMVFTLPFLRAAAEYKKNYYATVNVNISTLVSAYHFLLLGRGRSIISLRAMLLLFALCTVAAAWSILNRMRRGSLLLQNAELVFLILLSAVPFFGFLIARFVTHVIEMHHLLSALPGVVVLAALPLAPLFEDERAKGAALVGLYALMIYLGVSRIRAEKQMREDLLATLVPSPEIKARIVASPTQRLYITHEYEFVSYYEPDPFVRSHITVVYSDNLELRWGHSDTITLTGHHLQNFTDMTIVPYESLLAQPGEHIFLVLPGSWTEHAVAEAYRSTDLHGKIFESNAFAVQFVP